MALRLDQLVRPRRAASDPLSGHEPGHSWWIGLDGWVLQDGTYTDVRTGEDRQFALEVGRSSTAPLRLTDRRVPRCRWTGRAATHDVVGRILREPASPRSDAFVLDVGVPTYSHHLRLEDGRIPTVGDWVAGEVTVSVDYFAYVDELADLPGMPPLIHTWTVEEVQADATPLMTVAHGHPAYRGPDEGPIRVPDRDRDRWRTVDRTRTWADDHAYRLRCRLNDREATHTMDRSGPTPPWGPAR